jgi:single-strand DNA-binding protein
MLQRFGHDMSSVNKVILIGNLGRDPEIRYTATGSAIASLTVATSSKRKDKQSGEWKEETEWHRVSVFGHSAEFISKYGVKGKSVYVEGRLHTRSYDDKDGIKRYSTEINADDVKLLGNREGGERGGGREPEPYNPGDYSGGGSDDNCPF